MVTELVLGPVRNAKGSLASQYLASGGDRDNGGRKSERVDLSAKVLAGDIISTTGTHIQLDFPSVAHWDVVGTTS